MLKSKHCKGAAYRVVAIKSFVDVEREHQKGQTRDVAFETEIPADLIAHAASGGATVALPSGFNPTLKAERKFNADWLQKYIAEGEQVFAVRYRIVNLSGGGLRSWLGETRKPDYGQMYRANDGYGLYSTDQDALVEEDEDEMEDEEEVIMKDKSLTKEELARLSSLLLVRDE